MLIIFQALVWIYTVVNTLQITYKSQLWQPGNRLLTCQRLYSILYYGDPVALRRSLCTKRQNKSLYCRCPLYKLNSNVLIVRQYVTEVLTVCLLSYPHRTATQC